MMTPSAVPREGLSGETPFRKSMRREILPVKYILPLYAPVNPVVAIGHRQPYIINVNDIIRPFLHDSTAVTQREV